MNLFTVNLAIKDWPCLVVGGGAVGLPKAKRMIEAGGQVTLIDPGFARDLPGATVLRREATEDDLAGIRLAIFATDDKALNARLYRAAQERGILSAAADDLANCDFYMPAVLKRGDLEIAVSSGGTCPAYSVWVRDRLNELIDDAYGTALSWFAAFRDRVRVLPMDKRGKVFKALLKTEFMARFRAGRIDEWEAEVQAMVQEVERQPSLP
ncbi:MAG TPA: bifunctional precorrin-2 dehydrogenase/sirohydrochlorin ferrochelatase [Stenomitos sp.]